MDRPKWLDLLPDNITLANQNVILNYINWLEEEVKKMSQKLEASKREIMYSRRYNLTKIWDKGEEE